MEAIWRRLHLGVTEAVHLAVCAGHPIAAVVGGKGDPDDVVHPDALSGQRTGTNFTPVPKTNAPPSTPTSM